MEFTKEQVLEHAVEVVGYLNRVVMGLELNGVVCLPAYRKTAIKDCFLANARDIIMGATREQLEDAYDECKKAGVEGRDDEILEEIFKLMGNRAPNPKNEKKIDTVWFGIV